MSDVDALGTDIVEIELTGDDTPRRQTTVGEATAFGTSIDANASQIALRESVETRIEPRSKPYTAASLAVDVRERIRRSNTASRRSEPVSRA